MSPDHGLPEPDALSEPFWAATREGRYLVQWCTRCEQPIHYPRHRCPVCLGDALEWRPASGLGTVHAVSTVHTAAAPWMADRVPYVVALVDLDEGVRILTNLVETDAPPSIGQRVELRWRDLDDGRRLPQFAPTT